MKEDILKEFNRLLTECVNASHDCGAWGHGEEDSIYAKPYAELWQKSINCRIALFEFFLKHAFEEEVGGSEMRQ